MVITTTAFLCTAVGASAAYPRRLRLGAAMLAARANRRWIKMMYKVRRSVDGAIREVLDGSPPLSRPFLRSSSMWHRSSACSSGMARAAFKAFLTRRVPEPLERTVYEVLGARLRRCGPRP
jgi:hypothetical protein